MNITEYKDLINFWDKVKYKMLKIGDGGFEYTSLGTYIKPTEKDLKAFRDSLEVD